MDDARKAEFLASIEAQHSFPGPFTFKFIGKAAADFPARVAEAVREALALAALPPYTAKPTSTGAHVSVTLMPLVMTAADVIVVYERVTKVEGILVSL